MINNVLLYLGIAMGGFLGLFALYTIVRLCFKAIFKSYFEERNQHLTRGDKNEKG